MASQFEVRVDDDNKAVEMSFRPSAFWSRHEGVHMRGFCGGTISLFLAFFAWFAMAPIALDMMHSISLCENERFPPEEYPTRYAFMVYTSLETGESYCRYGKVLDSDGHVEDCVDPPEGSSGRRLSSSSSSESTSESTASSSSASSSVIVAEGYVGYSSEKYNAEVLPKCVCAPETHCWRMLLLAGALSIFSGALGTLVLGNVLENFGPIQTLAGVLVIASLGLNFQMGIWDEGSLLASSTLLGFTGSAIPIVQFWCGQMFSPSIMGTVSATTSGWGNLGAGMAQLIMVFVVMEPLVHLGLPFDTAWRFSLIIPMLLVLECSRSITNWCSDTPVGRYRSRVTTTPLQRHVELLRCLIDPRVLALGYQYACCFGVELVMNTILTTHFRTYFQMDLELACVMGGSFGLVNLFGRSLGGWVSDRLFALFGFKGRLWFHAGIFIFEAIAMVTFSKEHSDQPWELVLSTLVVFSLSVQMAEGSTFAILPRIMPTRTLAVERVVSALGNIGAAVALLTIYKFYGKSDPMHPFEIHAYFVCPASLLTIFCVCPDPLPKEEADMEGEGSFKFVPDVSEKEANPKDSPEVQVPEEEVRLQSPKPTRI
mmetsp:Transcript_98477/g.205370  ORF Transcript_98477/g.205370 Transcript_98477/m.205370 type:complete len:598 (+) Transcript_98477:80-1873(+)